MRLTPINLSQIKAIGHDGQQLGLLLQMASDRLEFVATPAPKQALDGLLQLAQIAETSALATIGMVDVDSSNLKAIGYAKSEQVLQVDFLSGSRYRYFNVPETLFERFAVAPSKGQFLNREIKGRFNYQQLL